MPIDQVIPGFDSGNRARALPKGGLGRKAHGSNRPRRRNVALPNKRGAALPAAPLLRICGVLRCAQSTLLEISEEPAAKQHTADGEKDEEAMAE